METTIDLMRQRAECIADYPESPFRIGDILEHDGEPDECWMNLRTLKKYINLDVSAYPTIFRPLAWWEKRKTQELPKYVKFCVPLPQRIDIREVWDFEDYENGKCTVRTICFINNIPIRQQLSERDLPATQQEYDQYTSSKQ